MPNNAIGFFTAVTYGQEATTFRQSLRINENRLDFSEHPQAGSLKSLALELIKAINTETAQSSPEKSVKGRRYIYINTNPSESPFYNMDNKLLDKTRSPNSYKTDEEYYNATYLGCVVKKLIDAGAIYKVVQRNGHGYFLQA